MHVVALICESHENDIGRTVKSYENAYISGRTEVRGATARTRLSNLVGGRNANTAYAVQ